MFYYGAFYSGGFVGDFRSMSITISTVGVLVVLHKMALETG